MQRGLAPVGLMDGGEIIIRGTLIEPQVMLGMWELQNRAHAMFNQREVAGTPTR